MEHVRIEAYKQVFLSRERGVRAARALFDYYADVCDVRNYTRRSKTEIATVLNVSPRTVANYIHTLRTLHLIKRKYNGATVLNPEYYYVGKVADIEAVKNFYADFKSDDIQKRKVTKW